MPATMQPIPLEETHALIAQRAQVLKEQQKPALFDINVSRRNNSGVPQQLASFNNATMEHIMDPLRWLPQLLGGGEYILNVRHPDIPERIGGPIGVNIDKTLPGMEPKAIDPRITRLPTWSGPTLVGGAYNEPGPTTHAGATVVSAAALNGLPQVGLSHGSALSAQQPTPDRERELQAQLAELRASLARTEAEARARVELENERRASAEKLREAERRADEAVRNAEARTQQQLQEMRSQIAAAAAAAVPKENGWEKLLTVVIPIVQQVLQGQQETRLAMLKMNEEQNRRAIETSEKQHAMQMDLIKAVSAKPGMSDEMRLLVETLKDRSSGNGNEAMAALMKSQLEGLGMMSRMATDLVQVASEIQLGDSEHPITGMMRAAIEAMKTMNAGAKDAAQRIVPKKPVQPLPQGMTPQQYAAWQQQQARARAAQAQAQAAAGRAAPPKQPGPQVVNVPPPPAPVAQAVPQAVPQPPPPAAPVIQPAEVTHFAEPPAAEPQQMQTPDGRMVTHFDILKAGILEKKDAAEVVDYFVQLKNADEPSLKAALDKYSGSPWDLLKGELGMGFVMSNAKYLEELGETIDAAGVREGWWEEADDEEGEEGGESESQSETEVAPAEVAALTIVPPAPEV